MIYGGEVDTIRKYETYLVEGETRMDIRARTTVAPCPGCGRPVNVGPQPKGGQRLACPNCGDYLEIINVEPLELDWAFDDFESDWEPDEEELEDEEWDEEDSTTDGRDSDYWEP